MDADGSCQYGSWAQTVRSPRRPFNGANPASDDQAVFQIFQGDKRQADRDNLTDTVRKLLLEVETYQAMSNDFWKRSAPGNVAQSYQSLEGPHNTVHGFIGGEGHMGVSCTGFPARE